MAVTNPTKYPSPGGQQISSNANQYNGFAYVLAWTIVLILMILTAKTKIGYTLLMIFAISSIMIVLAVGSPTIVNLFQSVTPVKPTKNG